MMHKMTNNWKRRLALALALVMLVPTPSVAGVGGQVVYAEPLATENKVLEDEKTKEIQNESPSEINITEIENGEGESALVKPDDAKESLAGDKDSTEAPKDAEDPKNTVIGAEEPTEVPKATEGTKKTQDNTVMFSLDDIGTSDPDIDITSQLNEINSTETIDHIQGKEEGTDQFYVPYADKTITIPVWINFNDAGKTSIQSLRPSSAFNPFAVEAGIHSFDITSKVRTEFKESYGSYMKYELTIPVYIAKGSDTRNQNKYVTVSNFYKVKFASELYNELTGHTVKDGSKESKYIKFEKDINKDSWDGATTPVVFECEPKDLKDVSFDIKWLTGNSSKPDDAPTFKLYKKVNGKYEEVNHDPQLNDDWSRLTFINLPSKENGEEIIYYVKQDKVEGFCINCSTGDGADTCYVIESEKKTAAVEGEAIEVVNIVEAPFELDVEWNDGNAKGYRPSWDTVKDYIHIFRDGRNETPIGRKLLVETTEESDHTTINDDGKTEYHYSFKGQGLPQYQYDAQTKTVTKLTYVAKIGESSDKVDEKRIPAKNQEQESGKKKEYRIDYNNGTKSTVKNVLGTGGTAEATLTDTTDFSITVQWLLDKNDNKYAVPQYNCILR